jgi:hypothetical protein
VTRTLRISQQRLSLPFYLHVPVIASLCAAGCGGIVDVSSGLPADKSGQELSVSELEQLCQSIQAYAEQHPLDATAGCRSLGLSNVTNPQAGIEEAKYICQAHYDSCISDGGPLWTFCDSLTPEEYSLGACTSTVAEIEDCLTVDIDRSSEIANGLRYCDEIDLDYVVEYQDVLAPEMRTPEGCESVRENCPRALN